MTPKESTEKMIKVLFNEKKAYFMILMEKK